MFYNPFEELLRDIEKNKMSEKPLFDEIPIECVNSPKHYQANGIEAIDVIEAYGLNFNLGNTIKYILRAERKGDKKQDLEKAQWYLNRELEKWKG